MIIPSGIHHEPSSPDFAQMTQVNSYPGHSADCSRSGISPGQLSLSLLFVCVFAFFLAVPFTLVIDGCCLPIIGIAGDESCLIH
ncbi:hypothetical protein D3C74_404120 [compost metagenome]